MHLPCTPSYSIALASFSSECNIIVIWIWGPWLMQSPCSFTQFLCAVSGASHETLMASQYRTTSEGVCLMLWFFPVAIIGWPRLFVKGNTTRHWSKYLQQAKEQSKQKVIEICIICVKTMNISNMDTHNEHCALTYHPEWLVPWHPPYPLEGIACDTACTTEWTEWWFQPAQLKDRALVSEGVSCCAPQGQQGPADHPEEMAEPGARAACPQRGPSEVISCSFEDIGKCQPGKE